MADPSPLAPRSVADRFSRLEWSADDTAFVLSGYRYLVEDRTTAPDPAAFRFYKPRTMVDQYERFFAQIGALPRTIVELGIWDGGSVAFWTDLLAPDRYLAVDKDTRGDSSLFTGFVAARGLEAVVDCRWGIDQGDHAALWSLLADHHLDDIDLVIDDASHTYGPTLATFAGLFPKVRPGGYYIIEDWSWPFRDPYRRKDHPWATRRDVLPIVRDVLAALGSDSGAVSQVLAFADFVAIQRGPRVLSAPLDLAQMINPRERPYVKIGVTTAQRYGRKALAVARQAAGRGGHG